MREDLSAPTVVLHGKAWQPPLWVCLPAKCSPFSDFRMKVRERDDVAVKVMRLDVWMRIKVEIAKEKRPPQKKKPEGKVKLFTDVFYS